jgi:hypothetical protein
VLDLLTDMTEQSLPRTETGSLLGSLKANAPLVQALVTLQRADHAGRCSAARHAGLST